MAPEEVSILTLTLPFQTYLVDYLASQDPKNRIFGLMFEDPTGGVLPWVLSEYVRDTRLIMDKYGWNKGHLLVHVHQAYGLAEAEVLEALSAGATGIWYGITRDGAAAGHANSLTTIANLHRLGNSHVRKTFNLARLRQAAIDMTKIITGGPPHPMTELYGSRALDICFDPSMMMGGGEEEEKSF